MTERLKFRDVRQRARVCRTLLSGVGLAAHWSEEGPDRESLAYRRNGPAELSREAEVLLMAAWALWNHTETVTLADLLGLDDENLRAIGQLLTALGRGPDQVEAWLRLRTPSC